MDLNPRRFLSKRVSFKSAAILPLLIIYVAFTFAIFFWAVLPSFENDSTSLTFATDSTVYTYFADSLREGRNEPWVLASLSFFPNTLWTPVFISFVLNSKLLIMITNYVMFTVSILLLKRAYAISLGVFIPLLLLNPTTTTSLLCVNKEILDLLCISLLLYARKKRQNWLLVAALVLALLNRYEVCAVMLAFIISESRVNPWRKKRRVALLLLVLAINFIMPLLGGKMLAERFVEAQSGNSIVFLDALQMHYLYVLAVIPKITKNMFGFFLNPLVWEAPSSWLLINFFNNVAFAILILITVTKRQLTLRNELVYFGALGSVIVAQALIVQPRYFYFVYILLCLQAAQKGGVAPSEAFSCNPCAETKYA